ncbi:MAG TPA: glycosyltransferase [Candidatus Paceibacterota bacterium]
MQSVSMKNPVLTIILPTYNEADIVMASLRLIAHDVGGLRGLTEIIFADDGSDNLPEVVAVETPALGFHSVRVMRNISRLGKGKSIERAFHEAKGAISGFLDIDLSVSPEYIPQAVKIIEQGNDICIATRVGSRWKSDPNWATSFAATVFTFIHRRVIFAGLASFPDTQCGFKFFRHDVARDLFMNLVATDGLTDLEVLLKATRKGYKIAEVLVPRRSDRVGKRPLSKIFVRETVSLWQIFKKYRLSK